MDLRQGQEGKTKKARRQHPRSLHTGKKRGETINWKEPKREESGILCTLWVWKGGGELLLSGQKRITEKTSEWEENSISAHWEKGQIQYSILDSRNSLKERVGNILFRHLNNGRGWDAENYAENRFSRP